MHEPCCDNPPLAIRLPGGVEAILAGAQTATVNFGETFQTIRGFGGSESWMPQFSNALANALSGISYRRHTLSASCLSK